MTHPQTPNVLRDQIMSLLYEYADVAPTPWLPDELWDKIMALIERESARRERAAAEEAFVRLWFPAVVLRYGRKAETIIPENEKKRVLSEMFPNTHP